MNRLRAVSVVVGLVALAGGCAGPAPAPITHHPDSKPAPGLVQLDERNWVNLADVRMIDFERRSEGEMAAGATAFAIQITPNNGGSGALIQYSSQAEAFAAWKRVVGALGGSLDESQWHREKAQATPVTMKPGATMPAATASPSKLDDATGVGQLNLDLRRLEACHDQKLLTDEEYQRGRAYIIAIFAASTPFQARLDQLLENLSGVRASMETGLLNEKEAAQLKSAIVTHYGFGEQ